MFRFEVLVVYLMTLCFVCMRSHLVRERTALINRYILHQNHSRCGEIKLKYYKTCEMRDKDVDKMTDDVCAFDENKCSDGSYNKTCMILYMNEDGSQSYTCSCHDQKRAQVSTAEYHWSRWYSLTDSRVGLYREMHDVLVTSPPALIKEYRFGIDYISNTYDLPDSSYTSSSLFDTRWYPHYMTIDHPYGWIRKMTDNNMPWIRIDMLEVRTILGLYLRQWRQGSLIYYVKMYHLKASVDGVTHYYIDHNIVMEYLMNEAYSTYWLDNATDGRYWTIEPVFSEYFNLPFLGGDFIGYV